MSPKKRRMVPLVESGDWTPMKTPCVSPEVNLDDPADPRVVLLVELPKSSRGDEHAIRLTADEADAIAADLSRQATACREQTNAREQP